MDNLTKSFGRTSLGRKRPLLYECCVCFCALDYCQTFNTGYCSHHLCLKCIKKYIRDEVETNWEGDGLDMIPCVDVYCLNDYNFEDILHRCFQPDEAEDLRLLAISKVHLQNKVTCPAAGCNATFDADFESTKKCTFDVCPYCHRGLCLACQTAWHPGVIKIRDDKKEEHKFLDYAYKEQWSRCPKCGYVIQKKSGCDTILCKCRTYFCYRCGEPSSHEHLYNCYRLPTQEVDNKRCKLMSISSTDKKSVEAKPESSVDALPQSSLRAGLESLVKVRKESLLKAKARIEGFLKVKPGRSVTANPEKSLKAKPGRSLAAKSGSSNKRN